MHKKIMYLIPPLLTATILLVVFLLKGIYPFGDNTIMWGDMYQINTPLYYAFHDLFYQQGSLFYNFKVGTGTNFYGVFFFFLSSPFSFIVLLFSRSDILYSMSIILLFKMMLISFTAFVFFNKYFKVAYFYKIVFSLMYAFCGYVLILHPNIMWLDPVYLFPLLLITLKDLYDKDKIFGYIVILTLNIIMCFYISYMVLFFIFFSSLPTLFFYVAKKERGKKILLLAFSTMISLSLSAVVLIPTYLQIKASSRLRSSVFHHLSSYSYFTLDKISFFFMGCIVYALVILLFHQLKQDKQVKFIGSLLFLTMIQVIFDSVNKLWHTGSYVYFPLRYGFIPNFLLLILGMYLISQYKIQLPKRSIHKKYLGISLIGIIILFIGFYDPITNALSKMSFLKSGLIGVVGFFVLLIITIFFVVSYLIILKLNKKRVLGMVILLEIVINSFFYVGIGPIEVKNEYQSETKLAQLFKTMNKNHYRVKDLNFDSNDSLVYDMHSNGFFTSLTNKNHMMSLKQLGYSSYWMRTSDIGGTLLSDSLLNQKYVIVNHKMDPNLYQFITQVDPFTYVYQSRYTLPMGMILNQENTCSNINSQKVFIVQNHIYQCLMNTTDNLIDIKNQFNYINIKVTDQDGRIQLKKIDQTKEAYATITIDSTKNDLLYLNILKGLTNSVNSSIFHSFNITINNQPLQLNILPSKFILFHKHPLEDGIFPQQLDNGLFYLGRFSKPITMKLTLLKNVQLSNFSIGKFDLTKFQSFIKQYQKQPLRITMESNRIHTNVMASNNETALLLSIPYDKAWTLKVNGMTQPISKGLGQFIMIPLQSGTNDIRMVYTPQGFKTGTIISVFSLLVLIIYFSFYRLVKIKISQQILTITTNGFIIIYALGVLGVYIIPIFLTICHVFLDIFRFIW